MTPIGHNGYSFDDVVMENLERGLLLAQRDCAARALQDHRLSQRHRVVLAQLILMTNAESGMAFPGRKYLAERTGYSEAGVAKTISELVDMAYVVSTRRAPEPGRRPLAHYAIIKPTIEELQNAIASHIEALRRPNVTPVGNVTGGGKVTPWRNVTSSDVTSAGNVTSITAPVGNVTPVEPTVTSISSLLPETPIEAVAKKRAKGCRLNPDWKIRDNPEWGRWTTDHFTIKPSTVEREAEKFRDFWIAKPGKDGTKADWFATWRNWARRAFAGKERDSFSDAALLVADVEQESEHDRQLAIIRQARRQDGLN